MDAWPSGDIEVIGDRADIEGELLMLTGTVSGHVAMWNLEKSRNVGQTRGCHQSTVASLFCVPGKPLLVSNGPDNSIKVWNYERPDGTPVLLRSRDGHWLPPTAIRWWPTGPLGSQVMSAGGDRALRVFCTRDDRLAFSMGRALLPHRGSHKSALHTQEQDLLPPASHVAACSARDGVWDSVALCHRGHRLVTTWSHSKRCRGKHYLDSAAFRHKDRLHKHVTAERCALSQCGNWLVVGYSSGHVAKFNIQSGIERGQFTGCHGDELAHSIGGITGLEIGQTGACAVVVSAAGAELALWDLASLREMGRVTLAAPVTLVALHPNGDMAAAATADGAVHLVQLACFTVFAHIAAAPARQPVTAIVSAPLVPSNRHDNNIIDSFRHSATAPTSWSSPIANSSRHSTTSITSESLIDIFHAIPTHGNYTDPWIRPTSLRIPA